MDKDIMLMMMLMRVICFLFSVQLESIFKQEKGSGDN